MGKEDWRPKLIRRSSGIIAWGDKDDDDDDDDGDGDGDGDDDDDDDVNQDVD